jgi:hypothetical protein
MKKAIKLFICFILAICLCVSLIACDTPYEEETTPSTETTVESVPDLNENAILILEDMIGPRIGNEDFIDTILAHVPDVFMLQEYRCACWTYFLVMSDGMEYIVITDYDGKITSIAEWFPESGECGIEFYSDPPTEE